MGMLALFLIANLAIAGGIITGTVTCKHVRNPRDTIVFIEEIDGKFKPPAEHAVMKQRNFFYTPHVLPVLVNTTIDFQNCDISRHNVFSSPSSAKIFDLGFAYIGAVRSVLFDAIGETQVLCKRYADMKGYVVCLQNPYFAKADKSGSFTIEDVPPGKYTLKTWHEILRPVSKEIAVMDGSIVKVAFMLKKKR
jgi:plastocyanin